MEDLEKKTTESLAQLEEVEDSLRNILLNICHVSFVLKNFKFKFYFYVMHFIYFNSFLKIKIVEIYANFNGAFVEL